MSQALEVGSQIVEHVNSGQSEAAIEKLYGDDIVSIEPQGSDDMPARIEGKEAVAGKTKWWVDNHDVHELTASGPFVGGHDDKFSVKFDLDVTFKPTGERTKMSEIGLYTVRDGKVVEEEFWYLAD